MRNHYPITIVQVRYSGTYEGGAFAAFHLYPHQLPDAAFGDDVTCAAWWGASGHGVGVGNMPDEAYLNLLDIPDPLTAVWDKERKAYELKRLDWGAIPVF